MSRFDVAGPDAWPSYVADWPFGSGALEEALERIVWREGLEGLIQRAETLPESASADLSEKVLRGVAAIGGRLDPIRTSRFVGKHAESAQAGPGNILASIVGAWGDDDPVAALEWLIAQPDSQARRAATRIAFGPWVFRAKTRGEAIAWVEKQPEEVFVSVIDLYAQALASIDPVRAMEAAKRIELPARRARILALVKRQATGDERAAKRARTSDINSRIDRDGTSGVEAGAAPPSLETDGAAEAE